jgi:hypothetical protein
MHSKKEVIKINWLGWTISTAVANIIFACLVGNFLTGIRFRYEKLNRERWSDEDSEQTNSLPQEGQKIAINM